MFRIAVMVEDRKLADVLRSVAGHVHNLEVVPVVIGDAVTKVDISRAPTLQQEPLHRLRHLYVTKRGRKSRDISPTMFGFKKGQVFSYRDLVPKMKALGMSEKSTWYVTMRMLHEKTVRRVSAGQYEVL